MSDDDADALYGLPLNEFVPARDALAKRLRADGRRDEAKAIAALRRPSVAAWAANQAIRSQPSQARELWEAGDALLAAHEALLAGRGDAGDLREAAARERAALTPLLSAAAGLLDHTGRGPSGPTLERVDATLHAAALEPSVRELAAAGRLVGEHQHVGLGLGALPADAHATATRSGRGRKTAAPREPAPAKRRRAREAEHERAAERARRAEARKAAEKAEKAEAALRAATAARERAEQRAAEAAEALEAAQQAEASAAEEAEEARRAAER